MKTFRVPQHHDRVFRSECAFSFDTPLSPGGLYVNLSSHVAFGEAYVQLDRQRTGAAVYLHIAEKRVPHKPVEAAAASEPSAPVKFGIGIAGGFSADAPKFDVEATHSIVVFTGAPGDAAQVRLLHPAETASLPSIVSVVVDAILAHTDVNATEAAATWEDKARPSRYADLLEVRRGGR
jgi:ubiquitin carboxyl-terminal hydrolase 5/13